MTAYLRPGVFVEESLNLSAPVQSTTSQSIAAFIGYTDRGPTDPTLVTSWSQYVSLYGGWTTNAKMHTALLLFFSNGGNQAYVHRVADAGADVSTRTFDDRAGTPADTLTINSANVGSWGNNINVTISNSATAGAFDLTVYYAGIAATNIVERYTDLTMTATDDRYAVTLVNSQSKFVSLVDEAAVSVGASRIPVASTNVYLVSGSNGAGVPANEVIASGTTPLDTITSSLVLNAPGINDATSVNLLTSYAEDRGDVFVVIDPVAGSAANQITRADSFTATSYGAVYFPEIVIKDPATSTQGVTKSVSPGGAIVGLYVSTDASRGVFKAPAGLQTRVGGAVSVPALTNGELDALNSNNAAVNAIKFVPGSGIVVMGSRTLKGTYVDRYVPIRRTLIYLRKSMSDLSQFAIFEPNDERLWRSITASLEGFLNNFWRQGGLRGGVPSQAFYVKCDAETNPQSAIDGGQVNIEVGVALQRPAEFVIIKIGQFDGGTTVTVA
jgi:phage tail sheath protein FI